MEGNSRTELGVDACWRLLRATDLGRLALVIDGRPEIFPVNYAVDQGSVVFRTASGTKLAALNAGCAVAFEVDGYDEASEEAWSVVVKGHGETVRGFTKLLDTTGLPIFPWESSPKSQFVRVVAEEITGRHFVRADPTHWDTPLSGARPQLPD